MKVSFDKSFENSITNLKNKEIANRLIDLINQLESAPTVKDIPSLKKLKGYKPYYRIRLGDYRFVFDLISPYHTLLILVAHRKEI